MADRAAPVQWRTMTDTQLPAPRPLSVPDRFLLVVATGFGAGWAPRAPGTAGTLVALPIFLALARLEPWLQLLSTAAFVALAIGAADFAGRHFGDPDDGRIVSDEIAGFLVTMALVPPTLPLIGAGFVLFRLFDIFKPWPASYFDRRVGGGLGNVMDDVCAGLYARGCLAALVWLGV